MEALVILLGSLLVLAAGIVLLPVLVVLLPALAGALLLFGVSAARLLPVIGPPLLRACQSPRGKRAGKILLGLGLAGLVGLVTVDTLLFEPSLRLLLGRVSESTGIEARFDSAEGSFLRGTATLHGLRVARKEHPDSRFDLLADRVAVSLSPRHLLGSTVRIDRLEISRLRGRYERIQDAEQLRARKPFRIESLKLTGARVELIDRRKQRNVKLTLELEGAHCEPFRSEWAVFCVLFRTNAKGRLDGQPFELVTREVGDGRETVWRARALPVAKLAPYAGAPLTWLERGVVDVEVTDRWALGKQTRILMDYKLTFRDLKARLPAKTSMTRKLIARPVVGFLNKHSREIPLGFSMELDRNAFKATATPEAAGLWRAFSRGVWAAFVEKVKPGKKRKK